MFGFGRKKRPAPLSPAEQELAVLSAELNEYAALACMAEEVLREEYVAECNHAEKRLRGAVLAEDAEAIAQYLDEVMEANTRLFAHAPILHAAKALARPLAAA